MMRAVTVFSVVCLALASVAVAQQDGFGSIYTVTGSVDVAYQSLYMWRGFDAMEGKSAIQVTGDVSVPGTGFGFTAAMHRANSADAELSERWDYSPYYQGTLMADTPSALDYRLSYSYYNFPETQDHFFDLQEIQALMSMPNALGVDKLVPSYGMVKIWPSSTGSMMGDASGFLHILMLDYEFVIPSLMLTSPEQTIRLHSELVYNDGADLAMDFNNNRPPIDHDWSHLVIGAATDFSLPANITITPAINYQATLDRSVHNKNVVWATVGAIWQF